MKELKNEPLLSWSTVFGSAIEAFILLNPARQLRNPVMFATYLGALLVSVIVVEDAMLGRHDTFNLQIALWLWFTVLFGNMAYALAQRRGKAHADALRRTKQNAIAHRCVGDGTEKVDCALLRKGDLVVCYAGEIIPADGEIVDGIATIDESAITGESAPVIRESGGDRSAVTMGTRLLSDSFKMRVTQEPGGGFVDRMIQLIESAKRQKTPNEIALNVVLSALSLVFLVVVACLKFYIDFAAAAAPAAAYAFVTIPILVGLFVCLIPTTVAALLNAIGIAGMFRLLQHHVIAKSGSAVEAAGDIDLLILDKTGTITLGNRMAVAFLPAEGVSEEQLAMAAQLASLGDDTPEGRSIVILAKERFNIRTQSIEGQEVTFVPFSATTRMSGADVGKGMAAKRVYRKGAVDAIVRHVEGLGGAASPAIIEAAREIAEVGATPLLVSLDQEILGVVHLKDVIKGGIKERFALLRSMGVQTIMVTGDNPITASAIALESGVDDFIAQATPEIKLEKIISEQRQGRMVAMAGDGTNDAPALAQADVGVAMNMGTQASREAGNMVDLDSNPSKLIEIVEVGKQILVTRGALTTFGIANDVAKYFAILPAVFYGLFTNSDGTPLLGFLNVMHLSSPSSAVLSAVIFNALIIVMLIPLALYGIPYQPRNAHTLLLTNLLLFGLGGLLAPFIGIKLIDLLVG